MGFFSWRTADTKLPIANNSYNDGMCRPVFLLQPGGKEPIMERSYSGYGRFGGIDAYEWLAVSNLTKEQISEVTGKSFDDVSPNDLREIGIQLESGSYLEDPITELKFTVFHESGLLNLIDKSFKHFDGNYSTPIPLFGNKSANELRDSGRVVSRKYSELGLVKHPLKFSFDSNAKYEDLPASKIDPSQGHFLERNDVARLAAFNKQNPPSKTSEHAPFAEPRILEDETPFYILIRDMDGNLTSKHPVIIDDDSVEFLSLQLDYKYDTKEQRTVSPIQCYNDLSGDQYRALINEITVEINRLTLDGISEGLNSYGQFLILKPDAFDIKINAEPGSAESDLNILVDDNEDIPEELLKLYDTYQYDVYHIAESIDDPRLNAEEVEFINEFKIPDEEGFQAFRDNGCENTPYFKSEQSL